MYLINDRKVTTTTVQIHRAALRFLYSATLEQSWYDEAIPLPKRIRKLPEVIAACDVAEFSTEPQIQALDHYRHPVCHGCSA